MLDTSGAVIGSAIALLLFWFLGFDFKTIIDKNAALIQMVRVSVDVQTGLYLKGGSRGEVEYKPGYYSSKIQSIEIAKEGTRSKELTDFSRRITYHTGGLVKIAYNLDPYESFHVKGKFADSFLKLYILEILLSIAIVGIIIILFKKLCRYYYYKQYSYASLYMRRYNLHMCVFS